MNRLGNVLFGSRGSMFVRVEGVSKKNGYKSRIGHGNEEFTRKKCNYEWKKYSIVYDLYDGVNCDEEIRAIIFGNAVLYYRKFTIAFLQAVERDERENAREGESVHGFEEGELRLDDDGFGEVEQEELLDQDEESWEDFFGDCMFDNPVF